MVVIGPVITDESPVRFWEMEYDRRRILDVFVDINGYYDPKLILMVANPIEIVWKDELHEILTGTKFSVHEYMVMFGLIGTNDAMRTFEFLEKCCETMQRASDIEMMECMCA